MYARTHTDNSNNNILYSFQWEIKAAVQPHTLKHNQELTLNSISIIKVNTDIKALRHIYPLSLSRYTSNVNNTAKTEMTPTKSSMRCVRETPH